MVSQAGLGGELGRLEGKCTAFVMAGAASMRLCGVWNITHHDKLDQVEELIAVDRAVAVLVEDEADKVEARLEGHGWPTVVDTRHHIHDDRSQLVGLEKAILVVVYDATTQWWGIIS